MGRFLRPAASPAVPRAHVTRESLPPTALQEAVEAAGSAPAAAEPVPCQNRTTVAERTWRSYGVFKDGHPVLRFIPHPTGGPTTTTTSEDAYVYAQHMVYSTVVYLCNVWSDLGGVREDLHLAQLLRRAQDVAEKEIEVNGEVVVRPPYVVRGAPADPSFPGTRSSRRQRR